MTDTAKIKYRLKKRTVSLHGAMQRLRLLWPMDPRKMGAFDLDAAVGEALHDLNAVALDKDSSVSKRDAELALRMMQHDTSGLSDVIGPALIQIVRRHLRSAGGRGVSHVDREGAARLAPTR
jgi:hypothetical protein